MSTERIHETPIMALAYEFLIDAVEEWASSNEFLVQHPEQLARDTAEYVFRELLGIPGSRT